MALLLSEWQLNFKKETKMRIATMATGGIGGFLAVKLTKAGHEVATIARGAHLEAIRQNGLRLSTDSGVENVTPWRASSKTTEIGPVDAIIFGVKCNALEEAAKECIPMLHETTAVIPFLNGVEAAERLLEVLPEHNVVNGLAKISTTISEPGTISQVGNFAQFIFAERNSKPSKRIERLQNALTSADADAPKTDDIDRDLWSKFVLFTAMSGVTAAARCNVGDILGSNALSELCKNILSETAMLGRLRGINLPTHLEADLWDAISKLPKNMRASTAIDLENNRPLETKWISGAAVRLAQQSGEEAHLNKAIYALLSPYEKGL